LIFIIENISLLSPHKSVVLEELFSNMKNMNWNDLKIFLLVAEGGGLSSAARKLNTSVPTIGRRMLVLEEAVGKPLFHRSQSGYSLTKNGETLLTKVRPMKAATFPLEEWLVPDHKRPLVRISAGTGTAAFLADRFSELWSSADSFQLAFVTAEKPLDISHREVEIGIRNRPAESGNLASLKLQKVCFAPYFNRHIQQNEDSGWVAIDHENAVHPAAHWVLNQKNMPVNAWANSPATLHSLIRAGAGIGVMPCFIGDRDQTLKRYSPVIDELTESQWLVTHGDDRHRPEVRTAADRIVKTLLKESPLLAGERPID
jgi:DNA-binding transcriptional LysR family regulator